MMNKYLSIVNDKGLRWCFHRFGYALKIKVLNLAPFTEKLYEKHIRSVKRLDAFAPALNELKKLIGNLTKSEKETIITDANKASNGIIKGFSSINLNYGNPINWQLNPLTGKQLDKNKKWFKIPDFNRDVGDIKLIWEISRFSHFYSFSRAYLLTSDIKYYKFFSDQLNEWVVNNRYSYGANFKCGQECSIRMMNVLFTSAIFNDLLTNRDITNISYIVETSLKKVLSNFKYAYMCQKNNHVLSELCGMIVGAYCTDNKKLFKKGLKFLNKSIHEQFLDDGGYIQQSFVYQRLAFQDLEVALFLLNKVGLSIDQKSKELINASILQMVQCMDSCGDMPNYGSNDGSLIFPMSSCGYRDFRPTVQSLYAVLEKKKLFENGIYDEEMLWFGVNDSLAKERISQKSSSFYQTGIFTFRRPSYWLMVVAKNKANHMDDGHIDVWSQEKNILCDSGTFSYADPVGDELLSTSAHNTIMCQSKEQLNRFGKFAFYGYPKTKILKIDGNGIEFQIDFKSGYSHKRSLCINDNEIIVKDESNEEFVSLFHSPLDFSDNNRSVRSALFDLKTKESVSIKKANRSLFYQKLDAINVVVVKSNNKTIITQITINGGY